MSDRLYLGAGPIGATTVETTTMLRACLSASYAAF